MSDAGAPIAGRTLIVRADASAAGGTGHLMRSLALAQGWLDQGGAVRWLLTSAPEALQDRLRGEGIDIERLVDGDGRALAAETPADSARLRTALLDDPRAVGAADGFAFGLDYLEALESAGARVLLVDDAAVLPAYPVAVVLNQNAHADRDEYPPDDGPRYLLGLDYVLLRREFLASPPVRDVPLRARRLLVTFGGADPTGMTAKVLAALGRWTPEARRDLEVRVLVGAANPDAERIHAAAHGLEPMRVSVERAIADMPAAIAWADLAVSSGGSTIWELARGGCPTLVVETVPIETRLVAGLAKVGLFGCLGAGSALEAPTIADAVAAKVEDLGWRADMATLGPRLVDGGGTGRVINALAEVGA